MVKLSLDVNTCELSRLGRQLTQLYSISLQVITENSYVMSHTLHFLLKKAVPTGFCLHFLGFLLAFSWDTMFPC